jgi:hypothetical protein
MLLNRTKLLRLVAAVTLASPPALYACGETSTPPAGADAGIVPDGALETGDDGTGVEILPDANAACPPILDAAYADWTAPADTGQPRCLDLSPIAATIDCLFTAKPLEESCTIMASAPECRACLVTEPDAAVAGPILFDGVIARVNTGGCVGAFIPDTTIPYRCGPKFAAVDNCAYQACKYCITAGGSVPDYESCVAAAKAGRCLKESTEARACSDKLLTLDAAVSQCVVAGGFAKAALQVGQIFCMQPPPDAGDQ